MSRPAPFAGLPCFGFSHAPDAKTVPARSPVNGARNSMDQRNSVTRRKRRADDRYAEKGRKRPYNRDLRFPRGSEVSPAALGRLLRYGC